MVVTGFPAETINKVAEEEGADLIVISASGKSGIHRFVIGSVAEKVLKNSNIDVLLVHND
jgi:nucleotide-binding universal stress UspA family protein